MPSLSTPGLLRLGGFWWRPTDAPNAGRRTPDAGFRDTHPFGISDRLLRCPPMNRTALHAVACGSTAYDAQIGALVGEALLEIDRLTLHSHQLNAVAYQLHVLRHPELAGSQEFEANIEDDLGWLTAHLDELRTALVKAGKDISDRDIEIDRLQHDLAELA